MKSFTIGSNLTRGRSLSITGAIALAAVSMLALPSARAEPVKPPSVPTSIQVLPPNKAFLVGHAVGTQDYSCLPAGVDAAGNPQFAWTLFTPRATLYTHDLKEITTHYFSPNPHEPSPSPFTDGPVRATWQHSRDTSTVWGKVVPGDSSSDAAYVAPGAIPWLRITVAGAKGGPTRGDTLASTTFLQRVNTSGGLPPSTGCASSTDVGKQAFVPYTADYYFYRKAKGKAHDND